MLTSITSSPSVALTFSHLVVEAETIAGFRFHCNLCQYRILPLKTEKENLLAMSLARGIHYLSYFSRNVTEIVPKKPNNIFIINIRKDLRKKESYSVLLIKGQYHRTSYTQT